jgi:hypothetical protein
MEPSRSNSRSAKLLRILACTCLAGGIVFLALPRAYSLPRRSNSPRSADNHKARGTQTDPWTIAQTVDPATLAKELRGPVHGRPTVVSVSPHALYLGGHIPGAIYQGPGMSPQAIAGLKRWAEHLPRSTNLVVYCGCCPLVHCPNLRPAFRALQSMGFTHLRALILPTNFYTDWYSKGYPTAKGN